MTPVGRLSKVVAIVVAGLLIATTIVLALGRFRIEPMYTYTAEFRDVSNLRSGNDVRAGGVTVGRVGSISLRRDNTLAVEFTVSDQVPVTTGTEATVRYLDLVGDRYLELTRGPGTRLADEGVLPVSRTHPALDLDELYNGFTPLFHGLAPDQINQLSGSLIAVFQGQAGAVEGLLGDVGSLTHTLADRDALIGQLVTHLNVVLDTADRRAPELSNLVVRLQDVLTRYAQERGPLGQGIERVNALAATLADLVPRVRPELEGTLVQVDRLAGVINADAGRLDDDLERFPGYYQTLGRLGAYSSAFNFYICGVRLRSGGQVLTPMIPDQAGGQGSARCRY